MQKDGHSIALPVIDSYTDTGGGNEYCWLSSYPITLYGLSRHLSWNVEVFVHISSSPPDMIGGNLNRNNLTLAGFARSVL